MGKGRASILGRRAKEGAGVLTAQEIEHYVSNKKLIQDGSVDNIQACSYDLRIGTVFREGKIINESNAQANDQIIIKPGEIVSIFTQEKLSLPDDVAATAFAINKMSSKGFLILNPGHVDPGYHGPLTVKAINVRNADMAISRGMDVFTVVFERLPKSTAKPYRNNYTGKEASLRRERNFNAEDVEKAARSLSSLIALGEDAPYPTRSEVQNIIGRDVPIRTEAQVKQIIQEHWMARLTLIFSAVAALATLAAAIFAAWGVFVGG